MIARFLTRSAVLAAMVAAILLFNVGTVNPGSEMTDIKEMYSAEDGENFQVDHEQDPIGSERPAEASPEIVETQATAQEETPEIEESKAEIDNRPLKDEPGSIINDDNELETEPADDIYDEEGTDRITWDGSSVSGYFTENCGQLDDDNIRFYIPGCGIWFTSGGAWFDIPAETGSEDSGDTGTILKQDFVGSNEVEVAGFTELDHQSNFFYGSDPENWHTDVPNYQELYYENIYDKIDLRYYITDNGLKYDLIVHPGGNPDAVRLKYDGADGISVNSESGLVIHTRYTDICDGDLFIYQEDRGQRQEISGKFNTYSDSTYGFSVEGEFDGGRELVIDPEISYSTFVGGIGYSVFADIVVDKSGNCYVTGTTDGTDFPTTPGAYDRTYNNVNSSGYPPPSGGDVFVFKLNRDGSDLVYSTYIGGNDGDRGYGIDVDKYGNAYITGETKSKDYPTTTGAYDTTFCEQTPNTRYDAIVTKLNNNGSNLLYSTFVGGNSHEAGSDILVDENGCAYVVGGTYLSGFPTTTGAYDTTPNGDYDAYVFKMDAKGSSLVFSTLIGGKSGDSLVKIIQDSDKNLILTGGTSSYDFPVTSGAYDTSFDNWSKSDGVVLRLKNDGTKILHSTYFGGKRLDGVNDIAQDSDGNFYITGYTRSPDFPTTGKTFNITSPEWNNDDIFVAKLDNNLSKLIASTLVGGSTVELISGLALDSSGNVFVYGDTFSKNFPITEDCYRDFSRGNAFLFKMPDDLSELNYSTAIGNTSFLRKYITMDPAGNIYLGGNTRDKDFPVTEGAYDTTVNGSNIFVMKIQFVDNAPPTIESFSASGAVEGSAVVFSVSANDPEDDTLTYSFDLDSDGNFDLVGYNNTASMIWNDEYSGYAMVKVSDGVYDVTASAKVVVTNAAPEATIAASSAEEAVTASMHVRIAGEKWHDVSVKLFKNHQLLAEGKLTREPGNPDEQILDMSANQLDTVDEYTAELVYTPGDDPENGKGNGATPCWVILEKSNGAEVTLHHTFNVKHESTHTWTVDLTEALGTNNTGGNVTFSITSKDTGADTLTIYLDFGDGTRMTQIFPNTNNTAPYSIEHTTEHQYSAPGNYTVTLMVVDDDGGKIELVITIEIS